MIGCHGRSGQRGQLSRIVKDITGISDDFSDALIHEDSLAILKKEWDAYNVAAARLFQEAERLQAAGKDRDYRDAVLQLLRHHLVFGHKSVPVVFRIKEKRQPGFAADSAVAEIVAQFTMEESRLWHTCRSIANGAQ